MVLNASVIGAVASVLRGAVPDCVAAAREHRKPVAICVSLLTFAAVVVGVASGPADAGAVVLCCGIVTPAFYAGRILLQERRAARRQLRMLADNVDEMMAAPPRTTGGSDGGESLLGGAAQVTHDRSPTIVLRCALFSHRCDAVL